MSKVISSKQGVTELQSFLTGYGFNTKGVDGLFGKNTKKAIIEMVYTLENPVEAAADEIKKNVKMDKYEVIQDIVKEAGIWNFNREQIAYILATVKHETGGTFQPVKEAFWLSENWRKNNLRYYPYYGKGYVQITWKTNYEKFSKITGKDLVNNPDLVMEHDTALYILLYGFKYGTFTGKKISDYINENQTDFRRARRCINGNDKAIKIAKYAEEYLTQF